MGADEPKIIRHASLTLQASRSLVDGLFVMGKEGLGEATMQEVDDLLADCLGMLDKD